MKFINRAWLAAALFAVMPAFFQYAAALNAYPETIIDEFDDLRAGNNNLIYVTGKWWDGTVPAVYTDTASPEKYGGDATRIFLNDNPGPTELIYKLDAGIYSFRITTFEVERDYPARYDLAAEASSDGESYTEIKLTAKPGGDAVYDGNFRLFTYSGRMYGDNLKYFKLILKRGTEEGGSWTPKISKIEFNPLKPQKNTAGKPYTEFYSGNGRIYALTENSTVTAKIYLNGQEAYFAAVAAYRRNSLLECHVMSVPPSDEYSARNCSLPPVTVQSDGEVKVFLWKSGGMTPVCGATVLDGGGIRLSEPESGIFTDDYENDGKISYIRGNTAFKDDYPFAYGGNGTRIVNLTPDDTFDVVYSLPSDIDAFGLLYNMPQNMPGETEIFMSRDGEAFYPFYTEPVKVNRKSEFPMYVLENYGVHEGFRFLKIRAGGGASLSLLKIWYGGENSFGAAPLSREAGYDLKTDSVTVPGGAKVLEDFDNRSHPYIIASETEFERIRSIISDEPYSRWYAAIKSYCDTLLTVPAVPFHAVDGDSDMGQFLDGVREIKKRIENLAFMWNISGDCEYAERCLTEINNACAYPTFYPAHALNLGEAGAALAIGYDWMYSYLSENGGNAEADMIARRIKELILDETIGQLRAGSGFAAATNNWNPVCVGGAGVAALSLMDSYPELASETVGLAVKRIVPGFEPLAPLGVHPEGPAYWGYGNSYAVYFMASLTTAMGTDYGLSDLAGFDTTGDFRLYLTGPSGLTFNFSDGGPEYQQAPMMYWLARRYNRPDYAWHEYSRADASPYPLIWYDGNKESPAVTPARYLPGTEDFAVMRGEWGNPNTLYAALKGGDNQSSHGDLDIGTFVLDAGGVRWADDLFMEDYTSPGYWDFGPGALRWTYYRKRAEGHNTVVINPTAAPGQNVYAVDNITNFKLTEGGASAALDMSRAYAAHANYVLRTMETFDNFGKMRLTDIIECKAPSDVWWYMHTRADIRLCDGSKTAILTQWKGLDKKTLQVELKSPQNAVFSRSPQSSVFASPLSAVNTGEKLTIHIEDAETVNIEVEFIHGGV
jgi:hypothetical protein